MTENEKLMQDARDSISNLFSDTSVSPDVALENLRTLQQEIEDMISVLQPE